MLEYVGLFLCCILGYKCYVDEDDLNGEEIEIGRRFSATNTKNVEYY